jgi:CheY-like chemotaxis protein
MTDKTVLVVDDEKDILECLSDRLGATGYLVTVEHDGPAALLRLQQRLPDVVFLDVEMPAMNGLEILRRIRETWADLPVIIMTSSASIPLAVEAMRYGATDYIAKPITTQDLLSIMELALQPKGLTNEMLLLGEVSHDVKNLLQQVVMGTKLLEIEILELHKQLREVDPVKSEESRKVCQEVIEMLRGASSHLHLRTKRIADDIQFKQAALTIAPCKLPAVVAQVLVTLGPIAQAAGIILQSECVDDLPTILADEAKLFSALYNLVNNAIPEVPSGGSITVRGHVPCDSHEVLLAVEDTGHGMSPQACRTFFTARQASRKVGGTGMGSKIIRENVEAIGGRITISSTEGVGTTFLIHLPLSPVECSTELAGEPATEQNACALR